jgi:LytS/YehU family sensor histidine kinase
MENSITFKNNNTLKMTVTILLFGAGGGIVSCAVNNYLFITMQSFFFISYISIFYKKSWAIFVAATGIIIQVIALNYAVISGAFAVIVLLSVLTIFLPDILNIANHWLKLFLCLLFTQSVYALILYMMPDSVNEISFMLFMVIILVEAALVMLTMGLKNIFNIEKTQKENKKINDVLDIILISLPLLKKGLDEQSAEKLGVLIYDKLGYNYVRIENKDNVLWEKGSGAKKYYKVPLMQFERNIGIMTVGKNFFLEGEKKIISTLGKLLSMQLEINQSAYQKDLMMKAERKVLQAQIRPHFLFNALNTINSFCRTNPNKARQLLLNLSLYLRISFSAPDDDFISLKKEVELIQAYLYIERARFSDRLKIKYQISPELNCKVPPFILQPIVENSVKHGLLPKEEGGTVEIFVFREEDYVIMQVEDDGVGMTQEQVDRLLSYDEEKKGIGLMNVNARLRSLYGENIRIFSDKGYGTCVILRIPYEEVG